MLGCDYHELHVRAAAFTPSTDETPLGFSTSSQLNDSRLQNMAVYSALRKVCTICQPSSFQICFKNIKLRLQKSKQKTSMNNLAGLPPVPRAGLILLFMVLERVSKAHNEKQNIKLKLCSACLEEGTA